MDTATVLASEAKNVGAGRVPIVALHRKVIQA